MLLISDCAGTAEVRATIPAATVDAKIVLNFIFNAPISVSIDGIIFMTSHYDVDGIAQLIGN